MIAAGVHHSTPAMLWGAITAGTPLDGVAFVWDAREAAYERYQDRYPGGWPAADR